MISNELPAVLQGRGRESSISMERALNQVKSLVEGIVDDDLQDRVNASLDDLDMMLRAIQR